MEDIFYILYLLLLAAASVAGALRRQQLSAADRVIWWLMILTFISETAALICEKTLRNNMYVSHIFSPLQLLLASIYYNQTIPFLKKTNLGNWIGITGVLLSICISAFVQPPHTYNSWFFLFESFAIIMLSLWLYFTILTREDFAVLRSAAFWIATFLMVFWSFSFYYFGLYNFSRDLKPMLRAFRVIFITLNFATYGGFFCVFIFYPKLIRSGE